jgi:alpha-D-ribose 1-methylphosphonate 5-triphosphate synthase subunit PhnH
MPHESSVSHSQSGSSGNLAAGFANPVFDSQAVFRTAINALSAPASILPLSACGLAPPAPLSPEAAAVLLALADFETPVWLDAVLTAHASVTAFLKFHTGATVTTDRATAHFAIVADASRMPSLDGFAQGEPQYPDRATLVIVQVAQLLASGPIYEGPGFASPRPFTTQPAPPDFVAQWHANHALFPRGVDLLFVAPGSMAALPRSTRPTTPVSEG